MIEKFNDYIRLNTIPTEILMMPVLMAYLCPVLVPELEVVPNVLW
jgi:hypothetical protein